MNESTIGGLPTQQVQPKGDARTAHQQPAERPDLERLQQLQARDLQKPVESEQQNRTGDPTGEKGSGVVVDLKTIPRAALPTVTGVSPARALSYAVAALKVELSTLFVILGQTGDTSSEIAEKVGSQIDQDIQLGRGGGTNVVQKVTQALDGVTTPPIKTGGGVVSGSESVDVSISVQDLQIRLGAPGAGLEVNYGAIDVGIERTSGAVLSSGDLAVYAREINGSEIDLATVESGILFTGSSEAVRSQAVSLGIRPEVAHELPPAARGNEPQRVATYGPQALRQEGRVSGDAGQEAELNVLRRRIDQAVTSLLLVNGGNVREAEGEKGLTLLSLDAVRPLFSRRDGQVQLSPGLVQFAQAAERATLPKDRITPKDFDTLA